MEKALPDYSLELKQANAFIFCQEDEYHPLQILDKFEQEHYGEKSTKPEKIEGGWYENSFVSAETLQQWAKLPSKKELLQTFCYYLQ